MGRWFSSSNPAKLGLHFPGNSKTSGFRNPDSVYHRSPHMWRRSPSPPPAQRGAFFLHAPLSSSPLLFFYHSSPKIPSILYLKSGARRCLSHYRRTRSPSPEFRNRYLFPPYNNSIDYPSSSIRAEKSAMRMSCNGCRVLRKGCSDNCSIRPCLQWIQNPDSQANATVFLAKFYGRTGLMNLIHAGPEHLRAAIFRSLLYEACGRIVNPIYGSVGLLWSGSWQLCQAAVDSVLKGAPIVPSPSEITVSEPAPPFKACDIRHVTRETRGAASAELYKVSKSRTRFKHAAADATPVPKTSIGAMPTASPSSPESSSRRRCYPAPEAEYLQPARSHDSSGFHPENESMYSLEASHVSQGESKLFDPAEIALELTLGHDLAGRHISYSSLDGQFWDTTFPACPAAADDCDVGLQL